MNSIKKERFRFWFEKFFKEYIETFNFFENLTWEKLLHEAKQLQNTLQVEFPNTALWNKLKNFSSQHCEIRCRTSHPSSVKYVEELSMPALRNVLEKLLSQFCKIGWRTSHPSSVRYVEELPTPALSNMLKSFLS